MIRQVVSMVIALCAVTTAAYAWQLPQAFSSQAIFTTYVFSVILLLSAAYVIFRRAVRRGYEQHLCLTPFPSFLQLLIWGLFFAFPCIYNPINWAWSQSGSSKTIPFLGCIGWICVGVGLVVVLGAMAWLGFPHSLGRKGGKIEVSGPYRLTRNLQLLGDGLLVIGYVLLWPSWFALGWLVLYMAMMHMMVLTEEEHLHRIHGEEFAQYCQ